MLIDGERVKALVASAQREVVLCAPFIKAAALKAVISGIRPNVRLNVYTRWRPEEVACGVSDLEVYDIVVNRENTSLFLLDELHAKLFVGDEMCLVGSANLTAAALGWADKPNVELLIEAAPTQPEIIALLERLSSAEQATYQKRSEIEELAKAIPGAPRLPEGFGDAERLEQAARLWLPRCAAPDRLFAVYSDSRTSSIAGGAKADALDDLADLGPQPGLSESAFKEHIAGALLSMPSIAKFINRISGKLTDEEARSVLAELRPDLTGSDLRKQWEIMRDWISVFFSDRFEVAPESFVVRLKST